MRNGGHGGAMTARCGGGRRARMLSAVGRGVAVAVLVAASVLFGAGTGRAQVPPRMVQSANACLAGDVGSCDGILRQARVACLFGNGFACEIADEIRRVRARIIAARDAGGRTTGDAVPSITSYCSDPRMGPQMRALNLCG